MPAVTAMPTADEAEDEMIGFLAGRQMRAFADHVADVAEHKQVADRRSGEADQIVRLADDQAAGKILRRRKRASRLDYGRIDFGHEVRRKRHIPVVRQIDKALGKFGVAWLPALPRSPSSPIRR